MIRHKVIRKTAAVLVLVALTGSWQMALAYTPGACQQDGEKLCPGLKGKDLTPCLKQHQAELSDPCKVNLAEAREMVRQVKDACQADAAKFCAGIQEGEGRIRKCLKAHEAELSSACKTQISAVRQKYQMNASTAVPSAQ